MQNFMMHHEMFRLISGNPTAIMMVAAIHANPMMKRNQNKLVDLYERIKSEKALFIEETDIEGFKKGKNQADRCIDNFMSLNTSTEMSVKLLE